MDRRRLHKIAMLGGGLVLIFGAVLVLRDPDSGNSGEPEPPPLPPPRTTVNSFADKTVVAPRPGARPKPPARLDIAADDHRLVVGWGPRRTGEPEPDGAAGYEVRWGEGGLDQSRLVAEPVIQLDGLRNNSRYLVEVRTVDAFGQRSEPARAAATPSAGAADPTPYSMVDRFGGPVVPEPARWRLVGTGNCAKASRGDGEDTRRLVITGQCGISDDAVALRSRTPLRLLAVKDVPPGGELGRFVVQTDRPGQDGELTLDLVPGPVDIVGMSATGRPEDSTSGRAVADITLPPGTIRVRISGQPTKTGVRVLVGAGTPLLDKEIPIEAMPPPEIGVSVRWEVVLGADGVRVLRDGVVVGAGDVVPTFTEATALVGFTGGATGYRAAIDLIAFSGAATETPPLLPAPRVDFERGVVSASTRLQDRATGRSIPGVRSGQLRITLLPQRRVDDVQFTVDIGGHELQARLAVPGQQVLPGVRVPIVADIPPEALMLASGGEFVPVVVRSAAAENGFVTQVLTASLELTGDAPPQPVSRVPANPPLPRGDPTLPTPEATLLDAVGKPIPPQQEVARGRLVLEVVLDARITQRITGAAAGLAGLEIAMDGRALAGISTAADGPGIGGRWRIALDTSEVTPGGHTIQITAIGSAAITAFTVGYAPFLIR